LCENQLINITHFSSRSIELPIRVPLKNRHADVPSGRQKRDPRPCRDGSTTRAAVVFLHKAAFERGRKGRARCTARRTHMPLNKRNGICGHFGRLCRGAGMLQSTNNKRNHCQKEKE